jgi:hypothetical protein
LYLAGVGVLVSDMVLTNVAAVLGITVLGILWFCGYRLTGAF